MVTTFWWFVSYFFHWVQQLFNFEKFFPRLMCFVVYKLNYYGVSLHALLLFYNAYNIFWSILYTFYELKKLTYNYYDVIILFLINLFSLLECPPSLYFLFISKVFGAANMTVKEYLHVLFWSAHAYHSSSKHLNSYYRNIFISNILQNTTLHVSTFNIWLEINY